MNLNLVMYRTCYSLMTIHNFSRSAVDSTSGATPGLEVVDVVASEWGPHLFNTGKRADLVRWREKANFLHDLGM